ncbi:MAG: hypothetical protein KGL10_03910 [Alphaproteobacteria bacterium]|nr:hypothetical protein [Alphaproteobacteria bacterium]
MTATALSFTDTAFFFCSPMVTVDFPPFTLTLNDVAAFFGDATLTSAAFFVFVAAFDFVDLTIMPSFSVQKIL